MKIISKIIATSEVDEDSRVDDTLKTLSDDFDYIKEGIEKLDRNNYDKDDILNTLYSLNEQVQNTVQTIANKLA
jgi:hypothetical protein